jgi:hypothetical protein
MKTRLGLIAVGLFALAAPVAAQPPDSTPVTTHLVEWDVSSFGDLVPGALAVDDKSSWKSKVWFVTRISGASPGTRLYRLQPGLNMKKDYASATSWSLGAVFTGGVRLRHSDDGRFAFVNVDHPNVAPGAGALVAIDTKDDSRITWADRPVPNGQMSDVATDTRHGGWNVFTAAPEYDPQDFPGVTGVVQRLRPGQPQLKDGKMVVPAEVTRFPVGGGAGTCVDTGALSGPCVPGITVDRRRGHPIYVSEPTYAFANGSVGAIGEIDDRPYKCPTDPYKTCAKVRHWPLPAGIGEPRQIRVDDTGRIWGNTSTGHLFSLEIEPNCDKAVVTRHDPVGILLEDLFAVSPKSGVIGFTDSSNNKVSVLLPEMTKRPVTPVVDYIQPLKKTIYGTREAADRKPHVLQPRSGPAIGFTYHQPGDGTYVETDISTMLANSGSPAPSMVPTGMDGDGNWKTGAFFYGVAISADATNRIGHLELRIDKHKKMEHRKGDRDRDHDGKDDDEDDDVDDDFVPNLLDDDGDNDSVPDIIDADKNGDGIEDQYQSPGGRESKRLDNGQLAPGQSREYEMEYDAHSVALLAIFEATNNVTAPLSIQILNDDRVVLLTTPAAFGKAIATSTPALPGVYTVRVTNTGTSSIAYKTTLIGRQIPY